MPRELRAWGCAFRCGRRVVTAKAVMARHERTCFMNPERRACKTCKHEHYWNDSPFVGSVQMVRECQHPVGCNEWDDVPDEIRWDCPHWGARDA